MQRRVFGLVIAAVVLATPIVTFAAERGTREEAIAMAERALALWTAQGPEATRTAVMDPANPSFHDRDLYVMIYDLNGINFAHGAKPALVGKDLSGVRDQDGVEIVRSLINIARTATTGWVNYKWPNPTTNDVENKSTYVVRLDDTHLAGVGIYVD